MRGAPTQEGSHSSLRLHGEIHFGFHDMDVRLTDLDIDRVGGPMSSDDGVLHLTLKGPMGELRKLADAGPLIAELLRFVEAEPADQQGTLRLAATPRLLADLARVTPPDTLPKDWLDDPDRAKLALSLDRYEPEAVGVVMDERSTP